MISVIIPTYNSEKTIKRCLDSIVEQTYPEWEVLLMDGVSKDDTLSIARSYNDSRIRIYSEPDKGIYDAMNKGILKSKGEWLYFLGSDDYLYDANVLGNVAKELSDEYGIIYGEAESRQLLPESKGEWTKSKMFYNRCHQAMFFNRKVFDKYGLYNISYNVYADFVYNLNCFWKHKIPTKYINLIIAKFSEGGKSSMGGDAKFEKDKYLLFWEIGRHYLPIRQKKELANEVIRNTESIRVYSRMKIYIYILRIVDKFNRSF